MARDNRESRGGSTISLPPVFTPHGVTNHAQATTGKWRHKDQDHAEWRNGEKERERALANRVDRPEQKEESEEGGKNEEGEEGEREECGTVIE
ncbi:hypothetical protein K437DRAFT_255847 [Tilletiaria anomala UBC 951]|uniref:Uncharacterized protein n=1 Tax=Tilletiaria anomala (strain ATCC 24038 / CBS 436.72 / UBC 951) TaxID=1037660 RepID=A0A066W0R4_TILAU|nr:uncharacterized protein K437DRAFT_255847 [Tilletiaria anomala UBC 951]KDN47567.1 hypothetical protein K437DRAFT_255847 [Tilletiaria anomala UBC 951]